MSQHVAGQVPAEVLSEPIAPPIDVSVCIVNWNCRDHLERCLQSLRDQADDVRLEVIVVDNASQDGAADMVADRFPEVILRRNTVNAGFARGNNQAADVARGRYLFFLNNDTLIPPGAVRRLFDHAEAHPEVGMIGPRLRDGDGKVQVSYRRRPTLAVLLHRTGLFRVLGVLRAAYHRYRRNDFDPDSTRFVETLLGAALFIRRDRFEECGRWDEGFVFGVEDLDLSVRVGRCYPLLFLPTVEITHYGRVSSRQHGGYVTAHLAGGHIRFLRKSGYGRAALWVYKLALTLDVPLQIALHGVDYLLRRLRGQKAKAQKSKLRLRGYQYLLRREMGTLWRQ